MAKGQFSESRHRVKGEMIVTLIKHSHHARIFAVYDFFMHMFSEHLISE